MMAGRYYTAGEIGQILKIKQPTIRLWTNQGRIPCAVNFGSDKRPMWRYPIDELDAWVEHYREDRRAVPRDDEKSEGLLVGAFDGKV
jgi:predicted site-specific integrase-resolvase